MAQCAWCGYTDGGHEPHCLASFTVEPPRPPVIEVARRDRDRAIKKAYSNADDEWTQLAISIITKLAETRASFTSDDVWMAGLPTPREPRALGGVFHRLSGRTIEHTDRTVQSVRRHAARISIWRSLIYRGVELTG